MSQGFLHDNRGVGIRHHQLILPSVVCSTHVARRIADGVGAITFAHQHGCGIIGEDVEGIDNFFAELADHPNVSSVLIVGLGCETIQAQELSAKLTRVNASTGYRIIQESGGVTGSITEGIDAAKLLALQFPIVKNEIERIRVGLDLPNEEDLANSLIEAIEELGMQTVSAPQLSSSIDNFSHLMREKVHVIISKPADNQPASGFPLIPVINIASTSPLHAATSADFDVQSSAAIESILATLTSTVGGKLTKAEVNKSGEIRAPRFVRSV